MKYLHYIFNQNNNVPRWVIFLIDFGICLVACLLAIILGYWLKFDNRTFIAAVRILPIIMLVKIFFMFYFRLYRGIIRHTSAQDGLRILYTTLSSFVALLIINGLFLIFYKEPRLLPLTVTILDFIISTFLLSSLRIFVKLLYARINYQSIGEVTNYAVFGAGDAGIIVKRKLEQQRGISNKVVAFFDDNKSKISKTLECIEILDFDDDFESFSYKSKIEKLIIASSTISKNRKQEIIENCLNNNVNVWSVPPADKWINGELSFNQIKNVKIEDILDRDSIEMDLPAIGKQLNGKVIMVTGAAGSIGSEIVNQLLKFKVKQLIAIDSSEVNLYELDTFLSENHPKAYGNSIKIILADVCNEMKMIEIFKEYKPEFIYHAAAFKHVPLMENNPGEAIRVNVAGTKVIADLAAEFSAFKFVMVSTDKAVNPTNIMGASKRIAEIYVQSLNQSSNDKNACKYIITRFGNVLGSSGSVIPKFKKQIAEGGPITVTDPRITRYFMTIPEACQLVLEAGCMGNGGEIYVFDMGRPLKIIDLAKKMVQLSGLKLGEDIQIVYSGLRPGEKIEEELLNNHEKSLPTHHPKIMIGLANQVEYSKINKDINVLLELKRAQELIPMVAKMKEIVPEFISRNSPYEALDLKISEAV